MATSGFRVNRPRPADPLKAHNRIKPLFAESRKYGTNREIVGRSPIRFRYLLWIMR